MIFRRFISNLALFGAGLEFLRLRGADLKYFQFIYPLIFAAFGLWVTYTPSGPSTFSLINMSSASIYVNDVSQSLIGFFLAALAAVVAFDGKSLDGPVIGEGVSRRSDKVPTPISRRQLLAALFGYCILLCLVFMAVPDIVNVLIEKFEVTRSIQDFIYEILAPIFFFTALGSLLSTSLLGLYYLVYHFKR